MGKPTKLKGFVLLLIDIILINFAYVISFYIRFDSLVPEPYLKAYNDFLLLIIILYIIPFAYFNMYYRMWDSAGIEEYLKSVAAVMCGFVLNLIVMFWLPLRVPNLVTIVSGVIIMILVIGYRIGIRAIKYLPMYIKNGSIKNKERVLIIGAGECAHLAINEIKKNKKFNYNIVALLDDDVNKRGTYLCGIKISGDIGELENIVNKKNIGLVILAIPSLSADERKTIILRCQESNIKIQVMPSIHEMLEENIESKGIRDVDLRDLLGREEIKLDKSGISDYLTSKVVLVTGGGGSIGSELCRQIAKFAPKELIILDIYENNAYELQTELQRRMPELNQKVIIASIRDRKRLESIFREYKPEVVFHAAAHKHVPLMEFNPMEAIKNNVAGTLNVAECANKFGVGKFVLISTDKAVNPTNVMGATKRLCEMIVQAIGKQSNTDFVAVRFGNVLGSNGSVIPLFKKQIEDGGPVTLTHKDITRYFMLIPEAAQLVLQAGTFAKGGEIFVLDMGKPVRIYDLAVDLIRLSGFEPNKDIKIEVVGLRPGEKLYEELLMAENELSETSHEKIFIEKPSVINYDQLIDSINSLVDISKMGSKDQIKTELQKIVPTYVRLDEVATTEDN